MHNDEIVKRTLLDPGGITTGDMERILGGMLGHRIDVADLYFQSSFLESWALEDGKVKSGVFRAESGVGVRAMAGEKTGFAYSEELIVPAIVQAANAAQSIAKSGQSQSLSIAPRAAATALYSGENPIQSFDNDQKVQFLQRMDAFIRQLDPRVTEVEVSLTGAYDVMMVVDTDGHSGQDVRPLVRLSISVVATQAGRRESGRSGGGGRYNYAYFFDNDDAVSKALAHGAVKQALVNLEAVDAPAGPMPVVLGPGWPGVLLHEAVGHGLEGDFNRKGTSAFSGRIGEQVASPLCTIVDDGTLPNRRGSLSVDDEGTATQCTTLIENGQLKGYMQDRFNARLMGVAPTGNGRRQSFAHLPMTRMTNTYMLPGESEPEEILSSVKKGIYAVNFGGGQVDITSGKFVFSANEAYLIEDGKITAPVKGATLIGNGPETMNKVSMVGNDLKLDEGVGVCGKQGQSVPVGVGQPTLLVDEIVVGGTS